MALPWRPHPDLYGLSAPLNSAADQLALLGNLSALDTSLQQQQHDAVMQVLRRMENRLDQMDVRLNQIDNRFEQIETRLEAL
jgi:hypothetical protein